MKSVFSNLIKNRYAILVIFFAAFFVVTYSFTGETFPSADTKNTWFYSGLSMLIFSILFIEPYYSSPKNAITNSVPLLLVLLSIKEGFGSMVFWWFAFWICLLIVIVAVVAIELSDANASPDSRKNKVAEYLRRSVVFIGQGKVLYSIFFLYFLLAYRSIQDTYTLLMFLFWFAVLAIEPKKIRSKWIEGNQAIEGDAIGDIFGVQSGNMFLAKIYDDKNNFRKFDVVEFLYAMDSQSKINRGIIFDSYSLDNQKWAKILKLAVKHGEFPRRKNVVYKLASDKQISEELKTDHFIGAVSKKSEIGKIRFEYSKKEGCLEEGDLIELEAYGERVFYQVINGMTEVEDLDKENKSGCIYGEAIQLGTWNGKKLSFEKFGWVPFVNTPLFLADTSDIVVPPINPPEYVLGVIPKTNLPSVLDVDVAVSHHLALFGVTGAGKSFMARELIKEVMKESHVICVDFTGEYVRELNSLDPVALIKKDKLSEVEEVIAKKEHEASQRNANKEELLKYKRQIQDKLGEYVADFVKSEKKLGLFELPDLSNTTFILEFTQLFLESVFTYAKNNPGQSICIVLEEAHTIIPETNFLGDLGDYGSSKALVAKMSQIALQGRKYGVGLFVIAQRTANVSKSVLTQCNTIICFQAFDETSYNFLGNYIGKDMVQSLPNLKPYHAIVTGKAVKSNIPMIVDLTRKLV